MAVNSSEEGHGSVKVLLDEAAADSQSDLRPSIPNLLEVSKPVKTYTYLDSQSNCQDNVYINMDNTDAYSACIVGMDLEKGESEAPKSNDETVANVKAEGPLIVLQREISFHMGGKFMQLLMNQTLVLPKFTCKDTPSNKLRKYKRSASFNSRKVALLFSALSSMGTMVLIYLTLRVRKMGDVSVHD